MVVFLRGDSMARENINPNPGARQLEVYNDFSGGLNSETSNERLRDNEFPIFDNVDLNGRGSARRRYGRDSALTSYPTGNGQGALLFHRVNQIEPDVILAVQGQFYLMYATPVSVTNETPTGTGPYTLAHPWVKRGSTTLTVSGTVQTFVDSPITAPLISTIAGTTNIQTGNYSLAYTYKNSLGETQISPVTNFAIQSTEQILVSGITLPSNVTSASLYMSIAENSTTLAYVGTTTGSVVNITALPADATKTPPTTNTATKYTVNYANGTITPVGTFAATPTVSYQYELASLPISGLSGGYQTTRPIESVQYNGTLYIATGTQLCQYDGTTMSVVTPYTPTPMEAIFTGLNGLASNPSNYISDTTQTSGINVTAIVPQYTTGGAVNQGNKFTAYVDYVSGDGIDYQWQYQTPGSTTWTTGLAFAGTAGTNKSWTFTPTAGAGAYNISVQAKDLVTAIVSTTYYLYGYNFYNTLPDQPLSSSGIQTCNQCVIYYDRLILAGDTTNPGQMYISDLTRPSYFPTDYTINWDLGRLEPITRMVQFRDALFVFQTTSVQGLKGTDPSKYEKVLIHPQFGAYAGRSVQVINDMLFFLSAEGIMALQPNMFMTYYNILRMDYPIRSEVLGIIETDCSSGYFDNQYWLCFPSQNRIYRYYFDYKAWVRDTGTALNFATMPHYGGLFYNFTQDSKLFVVDKNVYTDAGNIYTMKVQTKFFNFDEVFVQKKLRRMYVLAQHYQDHNVELEITVNADAAIILDPQQGIVQIDANGNTLWTTTTQPNFEFYAGTSLGSWILGTSPLGTQEISVQDASISVGGNKTNRIRCIFEHSQGAPCELFGVAFQFRLKRLR